MQSEKLLRRNIKYSYFNNIISRNEYYKKYIYYFLIKKFFLYCGNFSSSFRLNKLTPITTLL